MSDISPPRASRRFRNDASSVRRSGRDEQSRRTPRRYSPTNRDREDSRRRTETRRDERRSSEKSEPAATRLPFSKSYIITLPPMITDGLLKKAGCDGTGKDYVLEIRLERKK